MTDTHTWESSAVLCLSRIRKMSRSLWFGNNLQLALERRFTTVQCSLLSMSDLIWAINPNHTKVWMCSKPSRRNCEYFLSRAALQKQVFWKIFLEHIQLCFDQCPWFLPFFAEKRSLLRSDKEGQRLALLSAEKRSGLKSEKGGPTMMAEHGTRGDLWNVLCFV